MLSIRTRNVPLLLAAVMLMGAPMATAQVAGSFGSIYSGFGIGDRVDFGSSQGTMMGGVGVAMPVIASMSLSNPALWSDSELVHLSVGAEVQGLRAVDGLGDAAHLGAGRLSALHISVPLLPRRLGAAVSLRPYSRVNYYVIDEGMLLEPQLPQDTVSYRVHLQGSGGLHEVQLGFGWRPFDAFAVGVSGRALFGVIEDHQRTEYLIPAEFGEALVTRHTQMWGFGATIGLTGRVRNLLAENDRLIVGTSVTLPTTLQGRRLGTTGFSLDQDTLHTERRGTTELPPSLTAGLSYAPNARWLLATEARYEPWSEFRSDFSFTGYNAVTGQNELTDRLRIGAGVEFTPRPGERDAALMARSAYRIGGYFDRGYVTPENRSVATMALTGGVSLPALRPGTYFDLGFEVGTRGTTDLGLVRDLFIRGTATINFGERWFIRREFG